ncbi:hypothetical protein ACET3Z_006212 [Daucus carota]
MVGLSDIPVLGNFVDRISDATVEALFRGLRYLFCYKELVNVLNSEIDKVNIQQGRVSKKSDEERSDGKVIEDHVLRWQTEVKEMQDSAKEFSEKYQSRASWTCFKCLPIPKPVSRFRLGREAVLNAKKATELVKSGKDLLANEIAHLPPADNLPKTDAAFQDFRSRKGVYYKLWEMLVAENSSLILGIYGMPGVGKTRMMEQIWKEVTEKKIFKKVARANVGNEKLDVLKLQNQIAGHLGCHFESQDNVESRASQLKNCLINGGKILLVFDDVWGEIPLDYIIGTSFGESSTSKGSKILLTSRRQDVCLRNKCTHPVQITTLRDEEAWDLFQDSVGTSHIDSLPDETLAKEVCARCAGLPLLICAVGKALQFMSYHVWKDALQKLEKGKIDGIDSQVYACVKLSIDRLQDDAKLCLFLCSLFPEDADIDIRKLIQFAIGSQSQLIPDGQSTIPAMVEVLTKASLLLECRQNHVTKLHDIIRDVARSVAFKDPKYAILHVRCGSQFPDNASYHTTKLLWLDVERDDIRFPEDLVCTNLKSLWLHCNNHVQRFSGDFFGMFMNLEFLMLQHVHFLSEQFSLQPLDKLKMLIFDSCDIRETNDSLFPKYLKTLCIWACDLPSPLDLPNLKNLRELDIQQNLPVIMVPGAISSLSGLEEFHIPKGFSFSDDANDTTLILDEISKLTRLTSLKIFFSNFEACQGISIFFTLLKYEISVNSKWYDEALSDSTKMIEFHDVKVKTSDKAIQSLVERAEKVEVVSTEVDLSSICSSNKKAFADLRDLTILYCDNVEYIARISQDEIQHNRQPRTSFSKLTNLSIRGCLTMKYLFCKSVAKCLGQLQILEVDECPAMEVIVTNEGPSDGEIIDFHKLKTLDLRKLWSLKSFCRGNKEMHSGSTDNSVTSSAQFQPLFDGMVAFPSLEKLYIKTVGDTVSDIWGNYNSGDNDKSNVISSSFCKLKKLEVSRFSKLEMVIPVGMLHRLRNLEYLYISKCNNLRNAFPTCIARDLINLQQLSISGCRMMSEVIRGSERAQQEEITNEDHGIIVFPELSLMTLDGLSNLSSFCCHRASNTYKVQFPSLRCLQVDGCAKINLEGIELAGDDSTCQLKDLYIRTDQQMQLPCKWTLHLYNLESLTLDGCWWNELKSLNFPKLERLDVSNCRRSALFTISGFNSLQNLKSLDVSECGLLEEIVEDVRGHEHAGMDMESIKLSQLNTVVFKDLPKLKSFTYGSNYECYMPALKKVEIVNCGLSSLFTWSVFNNLQQLHALKVLNCILLEDIVVVPRIFQLSSLTLRDLPNLRSFGHSVSYAFSMPRLKNFIRLPAEKVQGVLAPPSKILNNLYLNYTVKFPCLEDFSMSNCGDINLEEIELVKDDSTCKLKYLSIHSDKQMELPCKWQPHLYNLERLTFTNCWWHELKSLNFPKLKKLDVNNCGISALFTISGFNSLQQLELLLVSNCTLLEAIVEDGSEDETSDTDDKVIRLSRLSSVTLKDLPNLTSFSHSVSYAFSIPVLKKIHLLGCPQLENFTSSETSTGSVSVYTEGNEREDVTDLNDFIIQNHKKGGNLVKVLENQIGNTFLLNINNYIPQIVNSRGLGSSVAPIV